MPIRRAMEVDALYDAVADYDLVFVPDPAFAGALNRRVSEPRFGTFASTPRRFAAGRPDGTEDRTAFLEVIDDPDLDWREIAYAVGNVLQCWEHRGSVRAILEYDAYVDGTTRRAVEILSSLRTTSQRLEEYAVADSKSVAVIGYDHLTPLERTILPGTHDRFELFSRASFEHPPFQLFESSTDIVTALLDTITPENADRVGIVLDRGSRYSSLVESALEAAGIPYYGGPGFIDEPHHRAFVRLLRLGARGRETPVADVLPVLSRLDMHVPVDHHEKRIAGVDDPGIRWLLDLGERLGAMTFGESLREYETRADGDLTSFDEELEALGLRDEPVTDDRVDALAFYLRRYDVPVDRSNEGVLLADATSSAYVDRPTVFCVGIDEEWTHSPPLRPWVDPKREFDRHIGQFERLLQSGQRQYYLVQDSAGGQPVTPCLYLSDLLDEEFQRFSDLPSTRRRRMPRKAGSGFETHAVDVTPTNLDTISQSSLNSYVNSPRDYFFDRLLERADKEIFVKGNLFHDFAEFYVEHSELVHETSLDELVELMLAEAAAFIPATDEPLHRRTYRIGLETIMAFLDAHPPEPADFLTSTSGWGSNVFADHFGMSVDSPLTERWFEDTELGIKGLIDLVHGPERLLDYKSGAMKSATQVVKRAGIDPVSETPNFQAILYLTYFRSINPDARLEFTFFHFLETLDDVIAGEARMEDTLTSITYFPLTFDEYLPSREAYALLLDGYNDCVETFDDLGYSAYRDIVSGLTFPETDETADLRGSEFAGAFTEAVVRRTDDGMNAEKGSDQAIRALSGHRQSAFFREDLDAFERFVAEQLSELNRRLAGDECFPVSDALEEPNYRRVNHRDLLLEGERHD